MKCKRLLGQKCTHPRPPPPQAVRVPAVQRREPGARAGWAVWPCALSPLCVPRRTFLNMQHLARGQAVRVPAVLRREPGARAGWAVWPCAADVPRQPDVQRRGQAVRVPAVQRRKPGARAGWAVWPCALSPLCVPRRTFLNMQHLAFSHQ
jgi:hypothetical protein